MRILPFRRPPPRTYDAKLTEIRVGPLTIQVAGRLDGYIDIVFRDGKEGKHTAYIMSLDSTCRFIAALNTSVTDVRKNCLYDNDALIEKDEDS